MLVFALLEAILLSISTLVPALAGREEVDETGLEMEAVVEETVFEAGRVLDDIVDDVEADEGD